MTSDPPVDHTELEAEFGISRNTIKKALDVLKAEGLVVTAPGRGLFVADKRDAPGR